MSITWNKITVAQFQEIHRVAIAPGLDDLDRLTRLICIVHGKTETEVDEMPMARFNELSKGCKFLLNDAIPGKPVTNFRIGTRKYAINYAPSKLKHRQYVEIMHFAQKPIDNLHYILASLVSPIKWGIKRANKADDHERLANEMLDAPITVAYHISVFFCKLFKNSIEAMQGYLVQEMTAKGMNQEQAQEVARLSSTVMDGFIPPNK